MIHSLTDTFIYWENIHKELNIFYELTNRPIVCLKLFSSHIIIGEAGNQINFIQTTTSSPTEHGRKCKFINIYYRGHVKTDFKFMRKSINSLEKYGHVLHTKLLRNCTNITKAYNWTFWYIFFSYFNFCFAVLNLIFMYYV